MTTLIQDRIVRVRIGPPGRTGRELVDLYARCRVAQTAGRTPNKAKLDIYNLKKDSLQSIEKPGQVLQVLAGETSAGQIFYGDISRRSVSTTWTPPDHITEIAAADGRRVFQRTLFSQSYPAQTKRSEVLTDLLGVMGLARGYIDPSIPDIEYSTALCYCDSAREVMSELWEPDGSVWSIQSGALQVVAAGQPVKRQAIVVSAETGLIGTPKRTDKGIEVMMDLDSRVKPGAILVVPSITVNGGWRVVTANHDFDTFGDQWQSAASAVIY